MYTLICKGLTEAWIPTLPVSSCLPKAPIKNLHLAISLLPPRLLCDCIPGLEPDLKKVRRSSRLTNHNRNENEEEEEKKIEKPEMMDEEEEELEIQSPPPQISSSSSSSRNIKTELEKHHSIKYSNLLQVVRDNPNNIVGVQISDNYNPHQVRY